MSKLTPTQNKCLHLWLRQWAEALRSEGVTMQAILENLSGRGLEVSPTDVLLKEQVWKVVQTALSGVDSTQDMETTDPDLIYTALCKWSGQEMGVIPPAWPSIDSLEDEK